MPIECALERTGGVSGRPAEQPRGAIHARLLPLQTVEGTSVSRMAARFAVRRRKGGLDRFGRARVELQLSRAAGSVTQGARDVPRRGTTSAIAMRWQPTQRLRSAAAGDSSFARCLGPRVTTTPKGVLESSIGLVKPAQAGENEVGGRPEGDVRLAPHGPSPQGGARSWVNGRESAPLVQRGSTARWVRSQVV